MASREALEAFSLEQYAHKDGDFPLIHTDVATLQRLGPDHQEYTFEVLPGSSRDLLVVEQPGFFRRMSDRIFGRGRGQVSRDQIQHRIMAQIGRSNVTPQDLDNLVAFSDEHRDS